MQPTTFVVDRRLRLVGRFPIKTPERNVDAVLACLRAVIAEDRSASSAEVAPVLVVPRVFERAFCRDLIDAALRDGVQARIHRRLVLEIAKAFQFHATRIERYIVACYDAESGGYFRPHRDNTTKGTAHRRFAVTINLNSEDYLGCPAGARKADLPRLKPTLARRIAYAARRLRRRMPRPARPAPSRASEAGSGMAAFPLTSAVVKLPVSCEELKM